MQEQPIQAENEIKDPEPLKNLEEIRSHILSVNEKAAKDYTAYKEIAGTFTSPRRIIFHCSDGRIDMSMYYRNPLERFRHPIIPMAGNILILANSFRNSQTTGDLDNFYSQNTAYVNNLFEYIFDSHLKNNPGAILDLQSHSASPNSSHHGCGAHNSDTANALKETSRLAYLLSKWNPNLQIIRTHNCTDDGTIYPAYIFDKKAPDAEGNSVGIGELRNSMYKFDPRAAIMEIPSKIEPPVFAKTKENPFGIDIKNHAEQTILISNTPLAHHASERQALRMAWHPEADFMLAIIKKLASIIQKNYLSRHPDAPIILHLDVPQNKTEIDSKVNGVRTEFMKKLAQDPELTQLVTEKKLFFISTFTNTETYKTTIG